MQQSEILRRVDHTLLSQAAGWAQIRAICDDGMRFKVASVCIPPCHVRAAAEYCGDKLPVCTVIGFPNGYAATKSKCAEARIAIDDGARELDMVINVGWLKEGRADAVLAELRAMREVCAGRILKVIIETCLLTDDEKRLACRLVSEAGADFIKTSTGFSTGGATLDDVRLLRANVAPHVKVKAAGGIRGLDDAAAFIDAGADRIGASKVVAQVKEREGL